MLVTKRKPATTATLEEVRRNGDRHVGLARRLRSPHIGSGDNGLRETSSFPRIHRRCTEHSHSKCLNFGQLEVGSNW